MSGDELDNQSVWHRRRRTPDRHDVAEVLRLRLEERLPLVGIMERTGLSKASVRRILTDEGYVTGTQRHDPEQRRRIAEAWYGGETQRSIAKREGISQVAVHHHIRRYMDCHRDPAHMQSYRSNNGWGAE